MSSYYYGKNEDLALWNASQALGVDPATVVYRVVEDESEEFKVAIEVVSISEDLPDRFAAERAAERSEDRPRYDRRDRGDRGDRGDRRDRNEPEPPPPRERREAWPDEAEILGALYDDPDKSREIMDAYPDTAKVVMVDSVLPEEPADDEPLSDDAVKAMEVVKTLVSLMGAGEEPVVEARERGDDVAVAVTGVDDAMVIGRQGRTVSAIKYIASKAINRGAEDRKRIEVEVGGFVEVKKQSLATAAEQLAAKATALRKAVRIQPMNAADRKIVHTALAQDEEIVTRSEGMNQFRRLLIIPKRDR